MAFKMGGWSGFQNSPIRDHEKDADGKVIQHEKDDKSKETQKDLEAQMVSIKNKMRSGNTISKLIINQKPKL